MFPLHAYMSNLRADLDIFIMYFILGLALVSPQNIIRYFFINSHNMGPANVAFYSGIIAMPWSIKPLYGIISDIIRSQITREVQIALGYCFSALCFGLLSFFGDISWCIFLLSLSSLFLACSDVVQDSIMVARSKGSNGRIQSISWAFRSAGSFFGCIFGATFTFHVNKFAFISLTNLLGCFFALRLRKDISSEDTKKKVTTTFLLNFLNYIYNKVILLFALVLFLYSYEPSDGSIMEYLLVKKFEISPTVFAISDMIAYSSLVLASLFFNSCLRDVNIYKIIISTNVVSVIMIILRNWFITDRITVDYNSFLYIMSFVGAFISQISFLPFIIISTKLSPIGMEGTVYSFFMAISNMAGILSRELSGIFTNAFGIKNTINFERETMDSFYFLCGFLDIVGLIGVLIILKYILPLKLSPSHQKNEELHRSQKEQELVAVDGMYEIDLDEQ